MLAEMAAADAALALRDLGRNDDARHYLEEWERLARANGNERSLARCLMNLGVLARETGDLGASARCFDDAYDISGSVRDWSTQAGALASRGQVLALVETSRPAARR